MLSSGLRGGRRSRSRPVLKTHYERPAIDSGLSSTYLLLLTGRVSTIPTANPVAAAPPPTTATV
jgi:hypothetical protein